MNTPQFSRRHFLKSTLSLVGGAAAAPAVMWAPKAQAQIAPPLLAGANLPLFKNDVTNVFHELLNPASTINKPGGYIMPIRSVKQALGLSDPLGNPLKTTVWAYGANSPLLTPNLAPTFPGPFFDVQRAYAGAPSTYRVRFVNQLDPAAIASKKSGYESPPVNLVDAERLLPADMTGLDVLIDPARMNFQGLDSTLTWANPAGTSPVPTVTHMHGGDNTYDSDGLPEGWDTFNGIQGRLWNARGNNNTYIYTNQQEAGFLWYHDHALSVTRTNVYMGLAGAYLIRDKNENKLRGVDLVTGVAPTWTGAETPPVLPSYPYEVPLVIQDRMFTSTGELFYPSLAGAMTPMPGVGPVQNIPFNSVAPEFFGDVILVNGMVWPTMTVEPRPYRFRILNGSDSRFYELLLIDSLNINAADPTFFPAADVLVVGTELGLLNSAVKATGANYAPVEIPNPALPKLPILQKPTPNVLAVAPGERYDVVIDFSKLTNVTADSDGNYKLTLFNMAAGPYPFGILPAPGIDTIVMQFVVNMSQTLVPRSLQPKATVKANTRLRSLGQGVPNLVALNNTWTFNPLTATVPDVVDPPAPTATNWHGLNVVRYNPAASVGTGLANAVTLETGGTVTLDQYPVRRLLLIEGVDTYGRLQPMLGTVDAPTQIRTLTTGGVPAEIVGTGEVAYKFGADYYTRTKSGGVVQLTNVKGGAPITVTNVTSTTIIKPNDNSTSPPTPLWDPLVKNWISGAGWTGSAPALADQQLYRGSLPFEDPVTELPYVNEPEIWEFYNTTPDAHPIHLHLVNFRIINRQAFAGTVTRKLGSDLAIGGTLSDIKFLNPDMATASVPYVPMPWEDGRKDTVQTFPGEVTRVLVNFDKPGEYVWHCHILSHEDHMMMRRIIVRDGTTFV